MALTLGDEQAQLDTIGTAAFASNQLAGDLVIPNKVTSIGNSAFKSNFLTGVESKGSIGSVVDYAFADNQLSLANIKITVDNNKLGDDAFASQTSPLTVGVGISGRWLTGVRAAIEKLIPKDTLKLGTTLVFTRNGSELTYDNQTDQLELPEGFNSYLDNLTVALASSGTTGTATDHTGNYSNSSLTLTWSIPNGGSTPADPESTPIHSASSNSQQPAQSDQLTNPAQPHQQVRPSRSKSAGNKSLRRSPRTTKTSQSRQDQRQATTGHQHQDSQPVVQRRRQGFTHNVALTAPAVNWQYRSGDRPLTPTKKQATKPQPNWQQPSCPRPVNTTQFGKFWGSACY
ncbi:leucine-rich repeat protein [Levilactobacillus angrenensis]|uniref:Leucine-rich repeat protein n=1 Tax=Levilactobacillus angrenensis TaxID=2486020 RepID=A0ABW1U691_9LACO|nr:leucine-rich repeat protein [Levilactobacillus angrenensis]